MGDPVEKLSDNPQRVTRLIRLKEVQHRVGLGRSTIYRWMSEGNFQSLFGLAGTPSPGIKKILMNGLGSTFKAHKT